MSESPVYLDFNATTPVEVEVADAIHSALLQAWGNPSSSYQTGQLAKELIQESREAVAKMIHCDEPQDIIFTSGGTETNNWVIQTAVRYYAEFGKKHESAKDNLTCNQEASELKKFKFASENSAASAIPHIITSNIEHDSVVKVLQHLERKNIAEVTYVQVNKSSACVEAGDVISAVKPNTCLISIMLANNETGVIQPISEISKKVKHLKRSDSSPKILIHTDAAQAIGKIEVNANELGVDYLTIVGHKFYGPRIGALYARGLQTQSASLYPMLYGGGQENNFRPGTENTAMIAGLGKAAEFVSRNLNQYYTQMKEVRDYLEQRLQNEFDVEFNGKTKNSDRLPNTCSVSFIGTNFQGYKILSCCKRLQAGVGAACHSAEPSQVLLRSGVPLERVVNSIRLSVGRHTTKQDIDTVVDDLKQALCQLCGR